MNEETIFEQALEQPPEQRTAYVEQACAGDLALHGRVQALLAGADRAANGGFLERPLSGRAATAPTEQPGDEMGWPVAGSAKAGRYRLVEKIGEGGCGVVWRAEQREPVRREVALKVIKLGMDTREVVTRFEAERQALALMDHPGIARVFDGGATEAGRPYFVMELVRGLPITRYCDEHALPLPARLELFIAVCEAVQHAHQKGIVHRDLKPSNILVMPPDGNGSTPAPSPSLGTPKVIDFGIAKATQDRLTEHTLQTAVQAVMGTPMYMSPEQALPGATDIDTRADIYSLGVILYELLTGETPFDRQTLSNGDVEALRQRIRDTDPPRPSTRFRTLDGEARPAAARRRGTAPQHLDTLLRGDLDWIVMRCLEKDRARRYATANALAQDLRRHLRHEPVAARPPSAAYLLQKAVRRHRLAFAAAAAVVATLVLGVVASTWQAVRATRAEREQQRLRVEAQALELAARRRAYASDLNLLQQALAADNFSQARALLDRQRPSPGQLDLRDWEWRYLWQQSRSEAREVLARHPSPLNSRSPGWYVYLAPGATERRICNLDTGEEFVLRLAGSGRVATAMSGISHRLAYAIRHPDGTATMNLRDLAGREPVRTWPLPNRCVGLVFPPGEEYLLTALVDDEGELSIASWNLPEGSLRSHHRIGRLDAGPAAWHGEFAVSPDFRLGAHAGRQTLFVFELATGKVRWSARAADELVRTLAFSPDGKLLVTGAGFAEPTIRLWDTGTGRELGRLDGHRKFVSGFVFLPDGKTLASSSGDQTIRLWDLAERRLLRTMRGHTDEVWGLSTRADGRDLISFGKDGLVLAWDVSTAPSNPSVTRLPRKVRTWQFARNNALLTVDDQGAVERWAAPRYDAAELLLREPWPAGRLHLAPDAPLLAAAGDGGVVAIWDWQQRLLRRTLSTGAELALPIGFRQQGSRLLLLQAAAGDRSLDLHEWDIETGAIRRTWTNLPGLLGDTALTGTLNGISPDETQAVLASESGDLTLIDLQTGARRSLATGLSFLMSAGFSWDGRRVGVASGMNQVRIWHFATLEAAATLSALGRPFHSVVFSPDGRRLATGDGGDAAMCLWDGESREPVLTLPGTGSMFRLTGFSPDGNTLAGMSRFGELHLWRAPSWAEIAAAEAGEHTVASR